jgi:hypothetical protein
VIDVGEEDSLVDGDSGDVLVEGALVRVPFLDDVCFVVHLLVEELLLHLLLLLLVLIPVTIASIWTFCDVMIKLTTMVANPL